MSNFGKVSFNLEYKDQHGKPGCWWIEDAEALNVEITNGFEQIKVSFIIPGNSQIFYGTNNAKVAKPYDDEVRDRVAREIMESLDE